MLIRSQDKGQLIPLETFVFSVYKSNIVCDKDCITEQREISERIIGRYSTEKKATKVLDMIQDAYGNTTAFTDTDGNVQLVCEQIVFQMPQDKEL